MLNQYGTLGTQRCQSAASVFDRDVHTCTLCPSVFHILFHENPERCKFYLPDFLTIQSN